ncbi:MAG TPA: hypothetical protein VJX74_09575, partial [Blastocatellia bacterium]|nr:hypothetical protein [Blastocatellia bacterium]
MKAKSEWREQSLDSNIKRKVLFNRQTGMTFLLIVSFFFLPFSFPKAMQKTEDRVAIAATD